jgi:serine-type D-Ala-D-Ala carboxypeptidase
MLDELLGQAVADGVFPGGVLVAGDGGRVVLRRAFGRTATVPAPGPPVTLETVYDVASLTKAAVTALLVLKLVDDGRLAWDAPARRWFPALDDDVRVAHLLSHSGGLPAWRPFFERHLDRDELANACAAEPLERPPGAASVYSDLGFILLGAIVERAGGDRLDALARRRIFEPLEMSASTFVDLERPFRPAPVAPTEVCPRRGLVVGEVHDENCHAAGGILGHAGLFSTAEDLSRLCAALVSGAGPFRDDLVATMLTPAGVPGSTWRLGWDGPAPTGAQAGVRWPRSGSGHLGFTGCSIWLDLSRRRWVVLLTNRVHPSRVDTRIRQVRPALHDAVWALLG